MAKILWRVMGKLFHWRRKTWEVKIVEGVNK